MNRVFAILALMVATLAAPASAGPATSYGEVGGWSVYLRDNSCYMIGRYDGETTLTVSVDGSNSAEFWLQNPGWRSLSNGSNQNIQVEFDSLGAWDINAVVVSDHDGPGVAWNGNISSNSNGDSFLGEFAAARTMVVRRNSRMVVGLKLTDTYRASMKLAECMGDMLSRTTSDPFAN